MGVPTSEVGYTSAMPRREDHEVHKDMWWHWGEKTSNKRFSMATSGFVSRPGYVRITVEQSATVSRYFS